ncbi:MAG: metallophosphoesterase family protein [Planctomycetota bacterium]|nr:metallophosphoesterase family protein [Planctomycetota bacterium]
MVEDHLDRLRRDHEADPDDPSKRHRFVQALKRCKTLPHYALIGNIHGNLEALQAVFRDLTKRDIPDVLCMGNIFGYGPNPAECLDLINDRCSVALTGAIESTFIYNSRTSISQDSVRLAWTRAQLHIGLEAKVQRRFDFFNRLQRKVEINGYCFVHGLPYSPIHGKIDSMPHWATSYSGIRRVFESFGKCLFVGHPANPLAKTEEGRSYSSDDLTGRFRYSDSDKKYILGIGSVWNRTNDPACYAEILGNQLFWHFVSYDNAATMAKLEAIPELAQDNHVVDHSELFDE